jgi:hypothetical protein
MGSSFGEDFDLCDSTFWKVLNHYGQDLMACDLPEIHQTVLLAWHSYGIIENGGFEYLFEGDFEGDPGFSLTCKAFENINCTKANEAFKEVLAIFPERSIIINIDSRRQFYDSYPDEVKNLVNSKFWSVGSNGSNEIERLLAEYIRKNESSFDDLD